MPGPEKGKVKERSFLRVPISVTGKIEIRGRGERKARFTDLSSGGVSFFLEKAEELPRRIGIRFRLPFFPGLPWLITAAVEARNTSDIGGKTRVGCSFHSIADDGEKRIDGFIHRFLDCTPYWQAMDVGAFLLLVDAGCRLSGVLLGRALMQAPFGADNIAPAVGSAAMLPAMTYFVIAFSTYIFKNDVNKRSFLVRLSIFSVTYAFFVVDLLRHLLSGTLGTPFLSLNIFLIYKAVILTVSAFSFLVGLGFLGKVGFVARTLETHRTGIAQRKAES